jgi:hypothetical protein
MQAGRFIYCKTILRNLLLCILLLAACSEFETKWTRRFDALGPGNYRINSIANIKESVYFTGTYTEHNSSSKCFLAKYNTDGRIEWHAVFGTPPGVRAQGKTLMIVSEQEEPLTTHSDICLLVETCNEERLEKTILARYDTLGSLIWQKTVTAIKGILNSDLLYDPAGNLYVAGWEEDAEGRRAIFIAKYSGSGELIHFTKYYYQMLDFTDLKFDVAAPDCFVLAGRLISTNEIFYIKYSNSGQFQNMVKYNAGTTVNTLSGLKTTPSGHLFMCADILNAETGCDFIILAYDPKDSLLWAEEYNGTANGDDHSQAISVDESLSVYVAGSTDNHEGIPNIITLKYNITGNCIWTQGINHKQASEPLIMEPSYVHLGGREPQAYLFIAGIIEERACMLRCNTNGIYSFHAQYGDPGAETVPTALSGKYMAFERKTEAGSDAFVVKYGPSAILGIARWD